MKTIVEAKATVAEILGRQRLREEDYRLMRYVIKTECTRGVLLHNVVTGQLVLLNDAEALLTAALPAPVEQVALADAAELVEKYFLVPIDFNDRETVDNLRSIMRKVVASRDIIKNYTILTTTCCNAHCFYCYQADYKHVSLTEQTASAIVDFVLEHMGDDSVKLNWFGGEPLMGMARIDQICKAIGERNVGYTSSMISNGFLFTQQIIARAVSDWHLTRVQITLDGTEDVYNRVKSYHANFDNAYRRVLKNIDALLNAGVRVSIRLNLDKYNVHDLSNLVDELYERFGMYEGLSVYVHELFENMGFAPIQRNAEDAEMMYRHKEELTNRIWSYGLQERVPTLPSLRINCCMADLPNAMVVYPDGRLFKCEHTCKGDDIGSLATGITSWANVYKFCETKQTVQCNHCPLYPACVLLVACPDMPDFAGMPYYCSAKLEKALLGIQQAANQ